jgi:hypothetical protein
MIHIVYQRCFCWEFWHGDFYPRWLAEANKGYGSPIFMVQYPLPYVVMTLLHPILHFAPTSTQESRELGVYCFLPLPPQAGPSGSGSGPSAVRRLPPSRRYPTSRFLTSWDLSSTPAWRSGNWRR